MKNGKSISARSRKPRRESWTTIARRWLGSLLALACVLALIEQPVLAAQPTLGLPTLKYKMQCADPRDPSTCVQPMDKGEHAPFDGQLMPDKLAIELGIAADSCNERVKIEVAHATATSSITFAALLAVADIDTHTASVSASYWKDRALTDERKLDNPPLFDSRTITAGAIGVVLGIVVVAIATR